MEYVLSIIGLPQFNLKRALAPLRFFVEHLHDHFIPHARNNYHPHILGHRSLALFSGLLLVVKIFTISMLSFGPVMPAFSSAITQENIIALTNESRKELNLPSLKANLELSKAAQAKADDMLAKGYFSHNTPEGKTPWTFITAAGYNYISAGENLAVNFTEAENVETAWMNSPGHKANIVNKNFEEIGIGISQGEYQGHTAIFVVQMFGTPAEQQVSLPETPTKVQQAEVPVPASVVPAKLGDSKNIAVKTVASATDKVEVSTLEPIKVQSAEANLDGEDLVISATTSGPVAKMVAYFGQEAIMLQPKSDGKWSGRVAISGLAHKQASLRVRAFNMDGATDQLQLADFSADTQKNYNLSGTTPKSYVTFMGKSFDPGVYEKNFYLFFVTGILSSLILAIAIKKHIQHLSLVANSSFVAIFAILIWWVS
jgi:hypothetical protein